jgi:WD repeat-containing protein 23
MSADIVTGKAVDRLRYHHEIVRDLSWHPFEPMLVTTSFDGTVVQWEPRALHDDEDGCVKKGQKRRARLPVDPGEDRLEEFY